MSNEFNRRSFLALVALGAGTGLVGCGPAAKLPASSGADPSLDPPAGLIEPEPTGDWAISTKDRAPVGLVEAYAGQTSVLPGEPVALHVSTSAEQFRVEAFRIGDYSGQGGTLIARSQSFPGEKGDGPSSSTGGAMVANWPVSAELDTADWPAGFYLLHVIANGRRTEVPLVVRSANAEGAVAFIFSATTWQAYNLWGDRSLYRGGDSGAFDGRSEAVSFDRPYDKTARAVIESFETPLVRVAEESGVPLAWFANTDIALDPNLLTDARAAISTGHDEYWPVPYRDALVKLRDSGGNLAFFGANTGYWRVRLSDPGSGPGRLMTCYKSASADPVKGRDATSRWRDSPYAAPENEVVGQLYDAFPANGAMVISDPEFFLFAGTNVTKGTRLPGLIGPETDRVYPLPTTPRPIQIPAVSPVSCRGKGTWSTVAYYTTGSGAGVFSTGTMGWSRSLPRQTHVSGFTDASRRFSRQVTLNVFRAMEIPGLGREHPATDQLDQVHLPATNTTGAA